MRRRIGYVGQLGGADASATGRENLLLQGRLYGMSAVIERLRVTPASRFALLLGTVLRDVVMFAARRFGQTRGSRDSKAPGLTLGIATITPACAGRV